MGCAALGGVSVLVMTAPGRHPERLVLLRRTIERALAQTTDEYLEVLVLDDGPEGLAWRYRATCRFPDLTIH